MIRQKLYEYIREADDKKVKAIYTMVEHDIPEYDWAADKEFVAELEKRDNDLQCGKAKGVLWEDAKTQITSSVKA